MESNNVIDLFFVNFKSVCQSYSPIDDVELGFNIFSLTSDFYFRENYHSYILAAFLDPQGKHNEGNKFLALYIEMLNEFFISKRFEKRISGFDFINASVEREWSCGGRFIDILIIDETTKKCIIIENKINNAVDQERQLPDYYNYLEGQGFDVESVVYWVLNEGKFPDTKNWTDIEKQTINEVLTIVPSYSREASVVDLYKNWIVPAMAGSNEIDSLSIIRQYGKLIKYLAADQIDMKNAELLFNKVTETEENYKIFTRYNQMVKELPSFLARDLKNELESEIEPFSEIWIYNDTTTVLSGLNIDEKYWIKVSINCFAEYYKVLFYDNNSNNIKDKFLEKFNFLSGFELDDNGYLAIKRYDLVSKNEMIEMIGKIRSDLMSLV